MPSSTTASALAEPTATPAVRSSGARPHGSLSLIDRAPSRQRADELYQQYGPAIYRRCLRLLRERDAARDATQDVFLKLLRQMENLEKRETALPWAIRVATNHCLDMLRDMRRHAVEQDDVRMEPSDP